MDELKKISYIADGHSVANEYSTSINRRKSFESTWTRGHCTSDETAKGIFAHRTADRRRDHFDHRRDRDSEPAALAYRRQRGFGGRLAAHPEHIGSDLQLDVPERGIRLHPGSYGP